MEMLGRKSLDAEYEKIFLKKDEILNSLQENKNVKCLGQKMNPVQKYLYTINKKDEADSNEYKAIYKNFYGLGRFSSNDFVNEYFKELQIKKTEYENVDSKCVMDVIKHFQPFTSSNQYSFSTKLLHTINNDYPIYDSKVGRFYCGGTPNPAMETFEPFYKELINEYKRIGGEKLLVKTIEYLDEKVGFGFENISFVKKIDFIIWRYQTIIDNEK
ncbi:MAG: hypothetical protein J6U04_04570 [Salinivirgaceae bacterium]|nr:hypothetical protein [Salinivirgaceae bacterium]